MAIDIVSRIVQLVKLRLRHLCVIALAAGVLLLSPDWLLRRMKMVEFVDAYGTWIALALLISVVSIVVSGFHLAWQARASRSMRAAFELRRLEYLNRLSCQEKSVLREFFMQGENTLKLPVDHPTVTGLLSNGILIQLDGLCERSLAGLLAPISIADGLRDSLVPSHINLPCEPVSDADRDYVLNNRPDFLPEIEQHNDVFHRSWRR